jgi:hypothetical protein
MPSWGLVTTIKAPEEQVLAFVAHHLSLGASQLWIYFDDPQDPAFARVAGLPRVTAIRCTDWYWAIRGGRKANHRRRQVLNARDAQRRCRLDWLGHVDGDEFLYASGPVSSVLADISADVPNVLMDVFEAMHDPDLPDDIFTARQFRGPLRGMHLALHPAIFGPAAPAVAKGGLGHTIGKSFCRPRLKGISLDLHLAVRNKVAIPAFFHPDLRVLHFHAHDPTAWLRSLPFRLARGAYHHPEEQHLKSWLTGASDQELWQFYQETMTLTPEKVALLQGHGRLITANLGLRAKVIDLLAGRPGHTA